MSYEPWPGQDQPGAGLPGWGTPPTGNAAPGGPAWRSPGDPGGPPTDPWASPGSGSGGPPPRRPQWLVPLAVLVAVAVAMVGATVLLSRPDRTAPVAMPTATRTPAPRPVRPTAKPTTKPKPKPKPKPTPVAGRTYSAPPDGVPIKGRVLDVNGRPVSGAKVTLTRHEGFIEGFGRAITVLFTLGLACLADVCTVPYGQGITNANGNYTIFLKPEVDDYDIAVDARGALVESRIDFAGEPLKLPTVKIWSPTPRLELSGGKASAVFAAPPASLGAVERYNAVVTDRRSGTELTVVRDVRSRQSFDARPLEDAPLRLRLSGLIQTPLGKTWYTGHYETQGRLRPPSRGKTCVEWGPGSRVKRATAPCRLITDGNFAVAWEPPHIECKPEANCDRYVGLDLGAVRTVKYLNVVGCSTMSDVQVSLDGRRWKAVEQETYSSGCTGEVSVRARYVRVGPFATRVTELSAWY